MSDPVIPDDLGHTFADPSAYTDLVSRHEKAARLRREMPIVMLTGPTS